VTNNQLLRPTITLFSAVVALEKWSCGL